MTDSTDNVTPRLGEISSTASAFAPVHFFEGVPFYAANDGIGSLALSATRLVDLENGEVIFDRALTAHLKGSLAAYRLLGRTIAEIVRLLDEEERQRAAALSAQGERERASDRAMELLRDAAEPEFRN